MQKFYLISFFILFTFIIPLSYAQENLIPERCVFPAILSCYDYIITNDSIGLRLFNGKNVDLEIGRIAINSSALIINCIYSNYITIAAGADKTVYIPCQLDLYESIKRKNIYSINITYHFSNSTQYEFIYGELFAKGDSRYLIKDVNYYYRSFMDFLVETLPDLVKLFIIFIIGTAIFYFIVFCLVKEVGRELFVEMAWGVAIAVFGSLLSLIIIAITILLLQNVFGFAIALLEIFLFPIYLGVKINRCKEGRYRYALVLTIFYFIVIIIFGCQPLNPM